MLTASPPLARNTCISASICPKAAAVAAVAVVAIIAVVATATASAAMEVAAAVEEPMRLTLSPMSEAMVADIVEAIALEAAEVIPRL